MIFTTLFLLDHMGNEENWWSAGEGFKTPRGIISYHFIGSNATTVSTWKVAGNLGGEDVGIYSPLFRSYH